MDVIAYTITLTEPVLATSLLGDPNSTESYPYIPGSTLRGLFAGRFRQSAHGKDDALFKQIFLSGHVRFLNAYPVVPTGKRCLPTPRALYQKKQDHGAVTPVLLWNRAMNSKERSGRWSMVKQPFCHDAQMQLQLVTPEQSIAVHVQRDRMKGRAWLQRHANNTEDRYGTVFRYEALTAGQQFMAYILIDPAVDAVGHLEQGAVAHDLDQVPTDQATASEQLAEETTDSDHFAEETADAVSAKLFAQSMLRVLLQAPTGLIGRSRSAGYGRVQLLEQRLTEPWREAPGMANPAGTLWTMTLLSPAILRTTFGEDVQQLDDATLSAYLGCTVQIEHAQTFTSIDMVGGFNRHWKLPLPQRRALRMGSVISFEVLNGTPNVAALEAQGIGDRREDGFGRIVFNWLTDAEYQTSAKQVPSANQSDPAKRVHPDTPTTIIEALALPSHLHALTKRTINRLDDLHIDAAIVRFVQRYVWDQVHPDPKQDQMPTNSQLSRLQTLVRQAAATGDTGSVRNAFLAFRNTARFAFERARLAGDKGALADWIYNLLDQPQRVWTELEYLPALEIGTIIPSHDDLRTRQAALRLLSAVLAAPGQRRKGSEFSKQVKANQ